MEKELDYTKQTSDFINRADFYSSNEKSVADTNLYLSLELSSANKIIKTVEQIILSSTATIAEKLEAIDTITKEYLDDHFNRTDTIPEDTVKQIEKGVLTEDNIKRINFMRVLNDTLSNTNSTYPEYVSTITTGQTDSDTPFSYEVKFNPPFEWTTTNGYWNGESDEDQEEESFDMSADDELISRFAETYPNLCKSLEDLQYENFVMMSGKTLDYGMNNIKQGGDIENAEDRKIMLMAIWFRMNEKLQRIRNIIFKDNQNTTYEPMIDSFKDISNFGLIAELVYNKKWQA